MLDVDQLRKSYVFHKCQLARDQQNSVSSQCEGLRHEEGTYADLLYQENLKLRTENQALSAKIKGLQEEIQFVRRENRCRQIAAEASATKVEALQDEVRALQEEVRELEKGSRAFTSDESDFQRSRPSS